MGGKRYSMDKMIVDNLQEGKEMLTEERLQEIEERLPRARMLPGHSASDWIIREAVQALVDIVILAM